MGLGVSDSGPDFEKISIDLAYAGNIRIRYKRSVITWLLNELTLFIRKQELIKADWHAPQPAEEGQVSAYMPAYTFHYNSQPFNEVTKTPSQSWHVTYDFHIETSCGSGIGPDNITLQIMRRLSTRNSTSMSECTASEMPKEAVEELYDKLPALVNDMDQKWPGCRAVVQYYIDASQR